MAGLLFLASGYVQSRCDSGVCTFRDRRSQRGGRCWILAGGSCGLGPQPSSRIRQPPRQRLCMFLKQRCRLQYSAKKRLYCLIGLTAMCLSLPARTFGIATPRHTRAPGAMCPSVGEKDQGRAALGLGKESRPFRHCWQMLCSSLSSL